MTLKGGATTASFLEEGTSGLEAGETGEVLCSSRTGPPGRSWAGVVLNRGGHRVRLAIREDGRRHWLEELFDGRPLLRFSAGFQTPDGACGDAVERIDLWDPQAVRCLDEKFTR